MVAGGVRTRCCATNQAIGQERGERGENRNEPGRVAPDAADAGRILALRRRAAHSAQEDVGFPDLPAAGLANQKVLVPAVQFFPVERPIEYLSISLSFRCSSPAIAIANIYCRPSRSWIRCAPGRAELSLFFENSPAGARRAAVTGANGRGLRGGFAPIPRSAPWRGT